MTSTASSPVYSRREIDSIIGENIHRLMWRAQESQVQIAETLGISQSALSNKLHGKRPWFAAEIDAMAGRYRVTPGSLFKELPHQDSDLEPIVFRSELVHLSDWRATHTNRAKTTLTAAG